MKNIILPLLALAILASCANPGNAKIETVKDSTAYSVGVFIASQLQRGGEEFDVAKAAQAVKDVYKSDDSAIKSAYAYMAASQISEQAFQVDSTFDYAAIIKGMYDVVNGKEFIQPENAGQYIMDYMANKTKGEADAFMAEIDKKEGIQKTESGIRYIIENQGEGTITENDKVKVHYTLYDYDGETLDSSVSRGEPLEVQLPTGVVKGFAESIQLVGVGGKLKVWIPAELGYGASGSGAVGPNQVLPFDIEVVSKEK